MDDADPATALDSTYFRRAGITAFFFAIVDVLIIFVGNPAVPLRFIGIVAAYFVVRDMMVLREAGIEWGWTRYLVLVFVAVGGFLGFFVYAWRRYQHLEGHTWEDATGESEDSDTAAEETHGEDSDTAAEDPIAEDTETPRDDTLAEDTSNTTE